MTTGHAYLHSSISPRTGPSVLGPAAVPASSELGRRTAGAVVGARRHARATEASRSEEDRMRLVAALLVLATLLLWILFLQGQA